LKLASRVRVCFEISLILPTEVPVRFGYVSARKSVTRSLVEYLSAYDYKLTDRPTDSNR